MSTPRMHGTVDPFPAGAAALASSLRPPPRLSLSEWAEKYYRLSPENSSTPGRLKLMKFQRDLFDMFTDPEIESISVMKAARIGYTLGLQCLIGYHFHYDPAPMMFALPTKDDIVDFAADTIDPMRRDIREVGEIVPERIAGKRQKSTKLFGTNGSSLTLASAQTPRAFRRITIRIAVSDENDGVETDARTKVEGNFMKLLERRTTTFWNRKIIAGSTPKVKGISQIEDLFDAGTQHEYQIKCPGCHDLFFLEWKHINWDKDADGTHRPETAHAVCPHCGSVIEESQKVWAEENGEFVRQNFNCPDKKVSVRINALISPFPNARWSVLVEEFLEACANPLELMPAFVNTILGETWEVQGQRLTSEAMKELREDWGDKLPAEVVALTAGVDIQADRWEVHVVGWTADERAYSVAYEIGYGDPTSGEFWDELDLVLESKYAHAIKDEMPIHAACVDSGHETQRVYKFVRRPGMWTRNVWAIKGMAGQGKPIWPRRMEKTKSSAMLAIVGVDNAKDMIYRKLALRGDKPGRFYFRHGSDDEFFDQLTSEERIDEKDSQGFPKHTWQLKPGVERNEVLDTTVYALAALEGLVINRRVSLEREGKRMAKAKERARANQPAIPAPESEPEPETPEPEQEPEEAAMEPPKKKKRVKRRRSGLRRTR